MSEIKWLRQALLDLERLHAFLKEKNLDAAARAAKTIGDGANLLSHNPEAGRSMSDETSRRELFLPFGAGAYILRYIIEDNGTVVIIRVWHSRENRPN